MSMAKKKERKDEEPVDWVAVAEDSISPGYEENAS